MTGSHRFLPRVVSSVGCRALPWLLLGLASWLAPAGQAHMRGLYATKAEAEKRAAELGCKGTFAMGSHWMPCANERKLHEALQKAR